jgi:hypothetical protein
MTDTLETYYSAGGPFIPPALLHTAQQGLLAVAIAVAGLFLANYVWSVGARTATKPGEARPSHHEHIILVVLQ